MRNRQSILWTLFTVLAVAAIFGAFILSRTVLELDRRERQAKATARLEENIRLSLWRLDSLLAPLLSEQSLLTLEESEKSSNSNSAGTETDANGIALSAIPIRQRFVVQADTASVSEKNQSELERYSLASLQQRLKDYSRFRSRVIPTENATVNSQPSQANTSQASNRSLADNEFSQRAQNFRNSMFLENSTRNGWADNLGPWWGVPFTPIWANDELLLVRELGQPQTMVQVVELDWPELKRGLERGIQDLLPEASIVPVDPLPKDGSPDMLVTIPCIVRPGNVVGGGIEPSGEELSVPLVLASVWAGVAAALCGIGVTLFSLLRLSDRREKFVAAVTHELRTPLTTLKLYSEMLSEGMVRDEDTKQVYLKTLAGEVDRIEHLVENVFAFARLDRARRELALEDFSINELIHSVRDQLDRMCQRAKIQLEIHADDAATTLIHGNRSAVAQILVNLIDNACKYASVKVGSKVHLYVISTRALDRFVTIKVIDNGPGFSNGVRWWRPFSKSVEEAAITAPGIGIGLAICKRLAKQQGGDLKIDSRSDGTTAELTLVRSNTP
ncbi:sensor histidine kinase [Pirellulaceae bacterium SH501]